MLHLAFLIMLSGHLHESRGELILVLHIPRLPGSRQLLFGLGTSGHTLGELSSLHLRGFPVEYVDGLHATGHHLDGAVEHALNMRGDFSAIVHELHRGLASSRPGRSHRDEELVHGHGGIDGYSTTGEFLHLLLFDRQRSLLRDELHETLNSHLERW